MTDALTDAEQLAEALHEAEHPGCVRHVSTYYGAQARRLLAAGWGRVNAADAELVALLLTEARLEREFYNTMGDVDPDQWEHAQAWTDAHEARCAAVLERLEAERGRYNDGGKP